MKKLLTCIIGILLINNIFAQQESLPKVYDEKADAMKTIRDAVQQAQRQHKYVCCQVGGNWCPWCLRFAAFVESDSAVHQMMYDHFVYVHVNYSKENQNPEAMRFLGNPGRFGYPVFVIINEKGEPIHIQNSEYLEEGKGYSSKKVVDFLRNWTPEAVMPFKQ